MTVSCLRTAILAVTVVVRTPDVLVLSGKWKEFQVRSMGVPQESGRASGMPNTSHARVWGGGNSAVQYKLRGRGKEDAACMDVKIGKLGKEYTATLKTSWYTQLWGCQKPLRAQGKAQPQPGSAVQHKATFWHAVEHAKKKKETQAAAQCPVQSSSIMHKGASCCPGKLQLP